VIISCVPGKCLHFKLAQEIHSMLSAAALRVYVNCLNMGYLLNSELILSQMNQDGYIKKCANAKVRECASWSLLRCFDRSQPSLFELTPTLSAMVHKMAVKK
jgi:hypothetical protein